MKIISLKGSIDNALFSQFITEMNEPCAKQIYLSTTGGNMYIALQIIDIINTHDYDVELIGSCALYSAGLLIYNEVTKPKRLLPHTTGMWHMGSEDITINDLGKPYYDADENLKKVHMTLHDKVVMRICKELKLKKKEIKTIKKGYSVYLSYNRMLKIYGQTRTE